MILFRDDDNSSLCQMEEVWSFPLFGGKRYGVLKQPKPHDAVRWRGTYRRLIDDHFGTPFLHKVRGSYYGG